MEGGEEGWSAAGFLRHDNALQQGWLVLAARLGPDAEVRRLPMDAEGRGEWTLEAPGDGGEWLLAISAVAPGTTESAAYTLTVEESPQTGG